MDGVPMLDLPRGSYQMTPSTELLDATSSPEAVLSMGGRSEFHSHSIKYSTESRVLDVIVRIPDKNPDGMTIQRNLREFLLRPPGDDPVISIETSGLITSYTFRDCTTMDVLGTVSRSLSEFGRWQLNDPTGKHRATLRGSLRNLLPWVQYGNYVLRTTDGTEVARYHHKRAEVSDGSNYAVPPSMLEIEVEPSPLPTEIVLTVAYTAFRQAHGSGSNVGTE